VHLVAEAVEALEERVELAIVQVLSLGHPALDVSRAGGVGSRLAAAVTRGGGMYARLSTIRSEGDIEEGRRLIRDQVLPAVQELGGFQGVISIGDATSGLWRTITLWDTEEDMRASEERANELRRQAAEAVGATTEPEVERYEVVYLEVESGVRVS
jgi:hypothetical protein